MFSPDGRRAFLSNVNGSVVVFDVAADGTVRSRRSIRLPDADAPRRKEEIPAGLAVSADGTRLYVCGNLSNTLLEMDVATGRVLRALRRRRRPVRRGARRRQGLRLELGRPPPGAGRSHRPRRPRHRGRVDPVRHIASEGTVTVIDLATGKHAGPKS